MSDNTTGKKEWGKYEPLLLRKNLTTTVLREALAKHAT